MTASETRLNARKALAGKWGKAALIALVYGVIMALISFILGLIPVVGYIISAIIVLPLSYGVTVTFINLKRGNEVSYTGFFSNGFNNFAKAWKTSLWTFVKMIVPIILVIISIVIIVFGAGFLTSSETAEASDVATLEWMGTIVMFIGIVAFVITYIYAYTKHLLYSLSFYILNDNPDMTAKEVVEESARLMKGKRMSYFCLRLSFIGWAILASIVLGIGYLWLVPYIIISQVVFYENLIGKNSTESTVEAKETVS